MAIGFAADAMWGWGYSMARRRVISLLSALSIVTFASISAGTAVAVTIFSKVPPRTEKQRQEAQNDPIPAGAINDCILRAATGSDDTYCAALRKRFAAAKSTAHEQCTGLSISGPWFSSSFKDQARELVKRREAGGDEPFNLRSMICVNSVTYEKDVPNPMGGAKVARVRIEGIGCHEDATCGPVNGTEDMFY